MRSVLCLLVVLVMASVAYGQQRAIVVNYQNDAGAAQTSDGSASQPTTSQAGGQASNPWFQEVGRIYRGPQMVPSYYEWYTVRATPFRRWFLGPYNRHVVPGPPLYYVPR